jgi:hypothetical protein
VRCSVRGLSPVPDNSGLHNFRTNVTRRLKLIPCRLEGDFEKGVRMHECRRTFELREWYFSMSRQRSKRQKIDTLYFLSLLNCQITQRGKQGINVAVTRREPK